MLVGPLGFHFLELFGFILDVGGLLEDLVAQALCLCLLLLQILSPVGDCFLDLFDFDLSVAHCPLKLQLKLLYIAFLLCELVSSLLEGVKLVGGLLSRLQVLAKGLLK